MKYKTQDPKFYIESHIDDRETRLRPHLVGQSGPVPCDEPLFILRARDVNAFETLCHYKRVAKESGADVEHLDAIEKRIQDFTSFARNHPSRMKVPDTDFSRLHDGTPGI